MKKYILFLPLLMAMFMAGCSDDDDYTAADPVKASSQQVHFSGDNKESVILDPTDSAGLSVSLKVVRNTTEGELTVPIEVGAKTSAGVTASESVTFANGDSVAYARVAFPDTASAGQSFHYSLTLGGDETDPYTLLDGGITFDGTASLPSEVKISCWITGYLDTKWEETALDLGNGDYRITDFMHSGYGLNINVADGVLTVSVPSDSPLYQEESDYGTYIYWYVDDYVHLFPYGTDGGVEVTDFAILNGPSYNGYYTTNKYGYFYCTEFQTTEMSSPAYWCWFSFQIQD